MKETDGCVALYYFTTFHNYPDDPNKVVLIFEKKLAHAWIMTALVEIFDIINFFATKPSGEISRSVYRKLSPHYFERIIKWYYFQFLQTYYPWYYFLVINPI